MNIAILISLFLTGGELNTLAQAEKELESLSQNLERFEVIELPKKGKVALSAEESITVDDLRGVRLEESPPVLGKAPAYDPRQTDDFPPCEAPYCAKGIERFRFRFFNCEFNYGGWHNFKMADYASVHGFNIIYPYVRKPEELSHLPKGTKWLKWGGFVNWDRWLPEHRIPKGRYDLLTRLELEDELRHSGVFKKAPPFDLLMIDMEHHWLRPKRLHKQPWYKSGGNKELLEKLYYEGYALTYISAVRAARNEGWKDVSLYGWQPFPRTYWGLEKVKLDPDTDWFWNTVGKKIYQSVDILNPSVYCFYWTPRNVAYVLANIDLNMKLVSSMKERKPVRPYYWTLLHGGGGGGASSHFPTRRLVPSSLSDSSQASMVSSCGTGLEQVIITNHLLSGRRLAMAGGDSRMLWSVKTSREAHSSSNATMFFISSMWTKAELSNSRS